MKEIIIDIKEKLEEGLYKNEEQVRFSLVARILKELNWDIWDPQEVFTEFSPDNINNKKVDIALFTNATNKLPVFIEIKATEKLKNPIELSKAENQLRDYNVNLTAVFTILTDGNYWRFYFSQTSGSFDKKCFKIIEIQKDDIDDIEFAFLTFLLKDEIINENAQKEASEYLQLTRKQQVMEECLPAAKRIILSDYETTLADALYKTVIAKGEKITKQEIIEFLKLERDREQIKTNTIQTTKSVNYENKIKIESKQPIQINNEIKQYTLNNQFDLAFTKVIEGSVNSIKVNKWQAIIKEVVKQLIRNKISINEIMNSATLNIQQGIITTNGFTPIPDIDYSIQGIDANKAGNAILTLANKYNIKIYIEFVWRDKPGQAAYPNEKCIIQN